MRLIRSIAAYAAILAVTLVFIEVVLRVADFRDIRVIPEQFLLPYDHDPEIGWFPVPHRATRRGRLNSIGFRDIEPVDDGRPTILFVGDSFVYGNGVKADERFTDVLRRELTGFRIVNAGVAAYGTDQEYLLLRRMWSRIKSSVVVLIVCVDNDHDDNSSNSRYGRTPKPYLAKIDGQWRFQGQPVPYSYRWYFYHNVLARSFALVRLAIEVYSLARSRVVTVPDPTNQLISMMREFVEQHGAKFLVGLQHDDPSIESFLASQKIPYTRFDGAATIPNDDHWNPQGHTTVAKRLKALFAAENVLGPAGAQTAPTTAPSR